MAANEIDKKVGNAVLELRNERGISRAEFARRVGKDPNILDRYMSGSQGFPLAVLMSCAVELEMGLDRVLLRAGIVQGSIPDVEAAIEADTNLVPGWKAALKTSYRAALASPDVFGR